MRLLIVCLLYIFLINSVMAQQSLTTDTQSLQFETYDEKLAFLQTYLNLPTDVEAMEYHIIYHDNSGGRVPGPSDWDMRVVVKVAPENVTAWLESLTETTEAFDLTWAYDLAKDWELTSVPKFFTGDKRAALFETEGIVVWWLSKF